MKRIILLFSLLFFVKVLFAQTDTIFVYSSGPIACTITELSDNAVKYKYEGENLVNVLSMERVKSIKLASGRIVEGKKRVSVSGEDGWKNVTVTEGDYSVDGLDNKGEITVYGEQAATRPGMKYSDNRVKAVSYAIDDIKKKAAEKGCHLVLIRRIEDVKITGFMKTWKGEACAAVNVTATLYSYPE